MARRRDVADLVEKLERLVSDPILRLKIGSAGMTFIRKEFDWERAVSGMEAVLSEGRGMLE